MMIRNTLGIALVVFALVCLTCCNKRQPRSFAEVIVSGKGVVDVLEVGMNISEVKGEFEMVKTHENWYLIPEMGASVETYGDGTIFRIVFYMTADGVPPNQDVERVMIRQWKLSDFPSLTPPYSMSAVGALLGKVYDLDYPGYDDIGFYELLCRGNMNLQISHLPGGNSEIQWIIDQSSRIQFNSSDMRDCDGTIELVMVTDKLVRTTNDWMTVCDEQVLCQCAERGRWVVPWEDDKTVQLLPLTNQTGCDVRFETVVDSSVKHCRVYSPCLHSGRTTFVLFVSEQKGQMVIDYSCDPLSTNAFRSCKLECKVIPCDCPIGSVM